jgi:NAD(P)-dependent dehydrogenase (short-subunit alcohol dehydrogenase family)
MNKNRNPIILITGSTDGIGKIAARILAENKAHVLIHGRNPEKVRRTVQELQTLTENSQVEGFTADLSLQPEVERLAEEVRTRVSGLDILINNAGVGFADPRNSDDGRELRMAVNYLAPFLLTHLLIPSLKKFAPSRIVNVSSIGQHRINFDDFMMEKNFDGVTAYRQSKLALVMFTFDLAEKLKADYITVNSLHPGTYLNTNMVRRASLTPLGEPESGARAVVYLATSPDLEGITGKYYNVTTEARADPQAYEEKARHDLWLLSLKLTGL